MRKGLELVMVMKVWLRMQWSNMGLILIRAFLASLMLVMNMTRDTAQQHEIWAWLG